MSLPQENNEYAILQFEVLQKPQPNKINRYEILNFANEKKKDHFKNWLVWQWN